MNIKIIFIYIQSIKIKKFRFIYHKFNFSRINYSSNLPIIDLSIDKFADKRIPTQFLSNSFIGLNYKIFKLIFQI